MLTRRQFGAAVPCVLLAGAGGAAAAEAPGALRFTAWRKNTCLGTHTVTMAQAGGRMTVTSVAKFRYAIGPIVFFAYDYKATETWEDGAVASLSSTTNDNGRHDWCEVVRQGAQLAVRGSRTDPYVAPAGSLPATHWNVAELSGPQINPQTGQLMPFTVKLDGVDPPPDGQGQADHYALRGFATLDLWYAGDHTWVGLRAVTKGGTVIDYRRA